MQVFEITGPSGVGRVECDPDGAKVVGPVALRDAVERRLVPDSVNGYDPALGGPYLGWNRKDIRHVNACLQSMLGRGELTKISAPPLPAPARYGFVDLRDENAIQDALPPAGSLNNLGGGAGVVLHGA